MKHHPRRPVRGAGRLEYPIEYAAMKTQVRVQQRAEVVDEHHRAQAGRGAAAGTVCAQAALDRAQQDAHDHALQHRIVVQEIARIAKENLDRYEIIEFDWKIKEFRRLVYETEHQKGGVCWCGVNYEKRKDGKMHVNYRAPGIQRRGGVSSARHLATRLLAVTLE